MIAHQIEGAGADVVLLLHGIGGGARVWGAEGSGTLAALASALGCRAVAIDLPGYGASLDHGPVTLERLVQAVAALAELLGPRRLALVGHSMGGMVAQEWLAMQPDAATRVPITALVLACTSSAFGRAEGDWQAKFVADRLAPLDAGLGMAAMAERLVPAMLAPAADAGARAKAEAVMARVPEATYRAALAAIVAFDRRAELAALRVPTLCLAGALDRTAPPEVMQRMAARLAAGTFAVLPDAGHLANLEQPAAFNAALIDFLRAHGIGG